MSIVSLWYSGKISVSHTGGNGFEHKSNPFLKQYYFLSLNSLNSVKAFRKNSINELKFADLKNESHQLQSQRGPKTWIKTRASWRVSIDILQWKAITELCKGMIVRKSLPLSLVVKKVFCAELILLSVFFFGHEVPCTRADVDPETIKTKN